MAEICHEMHVKCDDPVTPGEGQSRLKRVKLNNRNYIGLLHDREEQQKGCVECFDKCLHQILF